MSIDRTSAAVELIDRYIQTNEESLDLRGQLIAFVDLHGLSFDAIYYDRAFVEHVVG